MSEPSMRRPPAPRPLLQEALLYLTGEGRHHTPDELLAGLHARFRQAGRARLADLVYEMTKACLRALPDFSVRTRLAAEPRPPEVISGEMDTMAACLRTAGDGAELGGVARRTPETAEALGDARKCLVVLENLEGPSGRRQLALALAHVHAGEAPQGEVVLRELLARAGEPDEIRRLAEVNLAFALLRQARFAEVVPLARAGILRSPDDPVPWFNLLAAQCELGDPAAFEESVHGLAALQSRVRSPLVAAWAGQDLAMLGRVAGLGEARLAALRRLVLGPEGPSG